MRPDPTTALVETGRTRCCSERWDWAPLQRFEREMQLTSQLTHPNTIAIYDYGRTSEGVLYCVVEYVDGISLN